MREEHKKAIHEKYQRVLQKGERFWPDSIYKDLIISFAIFLVLVLLATFVGVPGEPKADPSDSSYVPKPEWYFLFLFKFLAMYGQLPAIGKVEWIAAILIPVVVLVGLFLLPLLDRNLKRHYSRRTLALTVMVVFVVSMIVLTLLASTPLLADDTGRMTLPTQMQMWAGLFVPAAAYVVLAGLGLLVKKLGERAGQAQAWTAGVASLAMIALTAAVLVMVPPVEVEEVLVAGTIPEQITAGQDLYFIHCVECHGDDGTVTVIAGVEGLEGTVVSPINSQDVMYTFTDDTLANIINYGQQDLGMQPFGVAYGGELGPSEIGYIVTFMRYSWDDRMEIPEGAVSTIPVPAEGEVPSYEIHIQPLVQRYCVSCHRAGKENNNFLMTSYQEILTTGDNVDLNIVAGDMEAYLILVINGQQILDPAMGDLLVDQMPPTRLMPPEYIDSLTRWIMAGMPEMAVEAQALSPAPAAAP
ncbi:MAG: c-type cytochrome [Anaerolineales bacterium]|nr:c-type cytochrome [Anaerolineales bacterium]